MSKTRRGERVKKKTTGRPSARADVEVSGNAQSAAERRAAEAEVSALIARFAPDKLPLITGMRKMLRKRLPTVHEVVYEYRAWFVISYSPSERGYEGVLAIRGDANGIKFYFNQGKDLPDPERLLQGSSQVRFIDVEGGSTLTRPAVVRLIDEALAHNRVPFARDGKGSVLIRSAAAKKKSR